MPITIDPPASPVPAPPTDHGSNLWEQLYEALGYHQVTDPEKGNALRIFCEGWCSTLQPVYDLVREREDGPAWAILFDVDRCPAASLPYLAQYVGVVITAEMTEEQIRNEIREPTGWARGQLPSSKIATRRTLRSVAGEELVVIVRPRTPEVGRHYVRTLLSQTPEPDRTERVVRQVLPAWEVLDYAAIDGVSYADIAASYPDFGELADAFDSYGELADLLPTELPEP
jgi:hypothetical protein